MGRLLGRMPNLLMKASSVLFSSLLCFSKCCSCFSKAFMPAAISLREMAPFDLSFDTWRALARVDFPFVTCRTRRSIHGSHDLFQNFMKIYSFHHMSHASIDTCSRRDFSSFSRGPREHRCVASVDRTCAAHEPSHVAHVGSVRVLICNQHVRGS